MNDRGYLKREKMKNISRQIRVKNDLWDELSDERKRENQRKE
jgi:hypothetical protein